MKPQSGISVVRAKVLPQRILLQSLLPQSTPRAIARTTTSAANSLLPLLIPASIAALGALLGWARRRRTAAQPAPAGVRVTVVTVVHRIFEAPR